MQATSFDAIGISITRMYNEVDQLLDLLKLIKQNFPNTFVIVGGPDVTLEWPMYMGLGTIDYALLGEGEVSLVRLLDFLDGRGGFDEIKGICYRDKGQTRMVPQGPPVDIVKIAWPARHLFPMENYFRNKGHRAASILTSRACPFSCAFCSTIEVWGRKWRGRPAKDVVDEIEHLVNTYGVKQVEICDDNFLVDRKRAEEIADGIVERKIQLNLIVNAGMMIHLLSVDLLKKYRKAGLLALTMQLESGNVETLKYIDKHIDINKAKELVSAAHALGLEVNTNVILGFYFEDKNDIDVSIRVAESIGFDAINYILAEPKPRTRMYKDCVKAGVIKEGAPVVMPVDTLHFKGHELEAIRDSAQRDSIRNYSRKILNPKKWDRFLLRKYIYHPRNFLPLLPQPVYILLRGMRRTLRELTN
jgi:anaerobic magnesium-protoporphyrin IX monomethyl ester cyclase